MVPLMNMFKADSVDLDAVEYFHTKDGWEPRDSFPSVLKKALKRYVAFCGFQSARAELFTMNGFLELDINFCDAKTCDETEVEFRFGPNESYENMALFIYDGIFGECLKKGE